MRSFFLPNWSPPDDPARPLPAEGRPWPSDDDDDGDDLPSGVKWRLPRVKKSSDTEVKSPEELGTTGNRNVW